MTKHVKLHIGDAAPAESTSDEGLSAESTDLLERTTRLLTRLLAATESTLERGEANSATLREASGLARAVASLSAEERARKKQAAKALLAIDAGRIKAWAREQDQAVLLEVVRDLTDVLDGTGSVLA